MNTNISTAVTISNDERLEAIVTFLSETTDISSAKDLYDATSPQFKAAKWLADDDSERLVVPSFSILSDTSTTSIETGLATATTSSPFNFVQRYVLVVLYFALGGDDNNGNDNDNDNDNGSHDDNAGDNRAGGWTDDYFFVSEDRHECSWYERVLLRTNENKNSNNNGSSHGKGDDCDDGDDGDDGDGGDNSNDDSDGHYYAMGVTCDRDLQVRNISLPSNNLKGTIPSEIQYLSKLDYLDLKHNGLSGSIPLALEELGQLSHLDLSDNELTGIMIPYWLGEKLMNLEFLNLSNNHLLMITDASSGVPNSLGGGGGGGDDSSNGSGRRHLGETLQTLALGGNNDYGGVTGTGTISIPEEIRYLTNLRELSLNNMNFGGTIPAWLFTDLKELRFLDLSHNQFTGSIGGGGGGSDHSSSSSSNGDHGLHSLQHLKSLVLHDNALTGTLSESIGLFQELSTLTLHHTNVTVGTEAANFICWRESLESLTTDCGDVTCPCCIEECCDSEDCFQDVDWDTDASFSTSTHNPI